MDTIRPHRNYVMGFTAVMAAVLLPVVALNYALGLRSLNGAAAVAPASQWQQATRGVTYAPPLSSNRPFKAARLFDRLPAINTIVFGSSTVMGVTRDMFPEGMRIYNFAESGNALMVAVAEAEYVQRTQAEIRWLVIPLDWAVGFVYQPGEPGREDLAPAANSAQVPAAEVSLPQQLADALSLPRVRNLFGIVMDIVRAASPSAAFRQMFLQDAGDEYRCADGTPAKDFDTIFRGTCTGFRYDGSATFANLEPVSARRAESLIAGATVASSKYATALTQSRGEPNPVILERIAALADRMRERGGGVILFMPPLLPGMERAILDSARTGFALRRTKEVLAAWARRRGLTVIDAGQSERYGCTAEQFVDEHHALPACYRRVFARFWGDARARGASGLWTGEGP